MPAHVSMNSVAAPPGGGDVATNMRAPDDPGFKKKFAAAELTASPGLQRWSATEGRSP